MSNANNSSWSQSNGEDDDGNFRRGSGEYRRGNQRFKNARYDNPQYPYRNNGQNYSMNNVFNNNRQWNNGGFNRRDRGNYKDSRNSSVRSSPPRNYHYDYTDESNTMPKYRSAGTAPNKNRNDYSRDDGFSRSQGSYSEGVASSAPSMTVPPSDTPSPDSGVSYGTTDSGPAQSPSVVTNSVSSSPQKQQGLQTTFQHTVPFDNIMTFPREAGNAQNAATASSANNVPYEYHRGKSDDVMVAMQHLRFYASTAPPPPMAGTPSIPLQYTMPPHIQKLAMKPGCPPGSAWLMGGQLLVQKPPMGKDEIKSEAKATVEVGQTEGSSTTEVAEPIQTNQVNRVSYSTVLRRGSSQDSSISESSKDDNATVVPTQETTLLPPDLEAMSNFAKVMSEDQQSQTTTRPPPPPSPLFSESGKFEVSKMDVLSETIWHYHTRVEQTEATLAKKLSLRDMLYSAIAPLFPMCGLYVVGSSLNGFGNNSSDMDLCLMITNKELDQRSDAVVVLNMILYQLQTEKFVAQQQLILAKVPILRITFQEPYEDITVDLNANNSVAIKNTHLLCYYSSFDWRVRPIVSVVKEWAKRKGINDANHSTFTSYSLVLMVIHYLQCGAQTPVLPSLQKLYHDRFRKNVDVRSLNVTQPLPALPDDGWKFNETSTLGELLIGFLDYYANHFNYEQDAISIREGCRIDKMQLARQKHGGTTPSTSTSSVSLNATVDAADKTTKTSSAVPSTTAVSSAPTATSVATPAPSTATGVAQTSTSPPAPSTSMFQAHPMAWQTQWRCICIEEPFTHTNTAHSVYDENVFAAIKEAFREAHAELEVHRDLGQLMTCKPINIKGPSAGAVVYYAQYNENKAQSTPTATVASTVPTPPAIPPMIPPAAISSAVHASISSIVPSSSSNVKSSADGSQMSTSGGANPTTTITPNGVVVQHTSTRNNNRNNNRYNSTSNSRSNSGTSQQKTPLVAKVTLPVRANDEEKENVSDVSADATSSTAASTTATTTMAPVPSLIKVVLPAADSSAPMAVPSVVSTAPSVAV